MTDSTTKLLRDLAYEQMMLAKGLDSDLYGQLKAQYSELCADYCDEVYEQPQREVVTQ